MVCYVLTSHQAFGSDCRDVRNRLSMGGNHTKLSFLSFDLQPARQLLKPHIHFHFNKEAANLKFLFGY